MKVIDQIIYRLVHVANRWANPPMFQPNVLEAIGTCYRTLWQRPPFLRWPANCESQMILRFSDARPAFVHVQVNRNRWCPLNRERCICASGERRCDLIGPLNPLRDGMPCVRLLPKQPVWCDSNVRVDPTIDVHSPPPEYPVVWSGQEHRRQPHYLVQYSRLAGKWMKQRRQ